MKELKYVDFVNTAIKLFLLDYVGVNFEVY